MAAFDIPPWVAVAVVVASSVLYYALTRVSYAGRVRHMGLKMPPGPKGIPILGNALQFSPAMPAHQFKVCSTLFAFCKQK
jgi:hypothetical protein